MVLFLSIFNSQLRCRFWDHAVTEIPSTAAGIPIGVGFFSSRPLAIPNGRRQPGNRLVSTIRRDYLPEIALSQAIRALRSQRTSPYIIEKNSCESGGIGRRTRLRIWRGKPVGVRVPPFAPTVCTAWPDSQFLPVLRIVPTPSFLGSPATPRFPNALQVPLYCVRLGTHVPLRDRDGAVPRNSRHEWPPRSCLLAQSHCRLHSFKRLDEQF